MKINISQISEGFSLSKINVAFQKIVAELNGKVLYRDNPAGEPNQMLSDLDMNSRRVYNLPEPVADHEPLRKGDLIDICRTKQVLRVEDVDIPAFPSSLIRRNKLVSFDSNGTPVAVLASDIAQINSSAVLYFKDQASADLALPSLSANQLVWIVDKQYTVNGGAYRYEGVVPSVGKVANILALKSLPTPLTAQTVVVAAYARNNKGGGVFIWDAASTEQEVLGVVVASNSSATGRWIRIASSELIDASWFGFAEDATGEENRDAILNAVTYSKGRKVVVTASGVFPLAQTIIDDIPVNLHFEGSGAIDRTEGTNTVIQIRRKMEAVQNISSFTTTSISIDGSSTPVVRVQVPTPSAFVRGDVVRVASDDIDPNASSTLPRYRGEYAVVAGVSNSYIYLSGRRLDDQGLYITNPRVGKLPNILTRLTGVVVNSNIQATGQLFNFVACHSPVVEITAHNHGQIVINSNGSYQGRWFLKGSGKGDSSGSLGYLFNDTSGHGNQIIRPEAKFFRHVVTTNHNPPSAQENLYSYGATRYMHVIDGFAESAQSCPWDEHPGARYTVFENCTSVKALRNTSTSDSAFQCRGLNATIINPFCDSSHKAMLRINSETIGHVTVKGGTFYCPPIYSTAVLGQKVRVSLHNCTCEVSSGQFILGGPDGENFDVDIQGGSYTYQLLHSNSAQFLQARGGARYSLKNPSFYLTVDTAAAPTGFRLFDFTAPEGAVVRGKATVSLGGFTASRLTNANVLGGQLAVSLSISDGNISSVQPGGVALNLYKFSLTNTTDNTVRTNFTDFNDFLAVLSGY